MLEGFTKALNLTPGQKAQASMMVSNQLPIETDYWFEPGAPFQAGPSSPFPGHFGTAEYMGPDSSFQNTYQRLSPGGSVGSTSVGKVPLYWDTQDIISGATIGAGRN